MQQLGNIEAIGKNLWSATDNLSANSKLKAMEYSILVQGLISLRYADVRSTEDKKVFDWQEKG